MERSGLTLRTEQATVNMIAQLRCAGELKALIVTN